MYFYDVTGLQCRYVKPGTTLAAWCQKNKPFACCNASLYKSNGEPIGTIIESGKMVHDAGNGYGVGIIDGILDFGKPWEKKWTDYLTGYISPVQDGKYVAPTFKDSYVFDGKLHRVGIARKSGKTYIVTDNSVTLAQFAQNAIRNGCDTLVNLDGGGSRFVWHNRAVRYTSSRTPYNALVWLDESDLALEWAREKGIVTDESDRKIALALWRYHMLKL